MQTIRGWFKSNHPSPQEKGQQQITSPPAEGMDDDARIGKTQPTISDNQQDRNTSSNAQQKTQHVRHSIKRSHSHDYRSSPEGDGRGLGNVGGSRETSTTGAAAGQQQQRQNAAKRPSTKADREDPPHTRGGEPASVSTPPAASPAPHPAPRQAASEIVRDFFRECPHGEANRYTILQVVGKGSYGVVCSAVDNYTGEKVAIKKIHSIFDHVSDATRILREIKLLRLLKHPDIVEIKHIMLPPSPTDYKDIYVVFELLETDLHQVIKANDDLTPEHHQFFLYQMLRGLKFIHSAKVFHRDLKPKNILANADCKLKICDFGLARPAFNDMPTTIFWTDYVATRWYRAPELCGSFFARYSPAIDIWSIGCIFAEVLLGRPLFPGKNVVHQLELITDLLGTPSFDVMSRVRNEKARRFLAGMERKRGIPFSQVFPGVDPRAISLLRRMLSFDPTLRPTAEEALQDPYFSGLHHPSREPVAKPVSKVAFEFEKRKLTVEEVRELIYVETLEYHPREKADYASGASQSAFSNPSALDSFKRQFMHLEQNAGTVIDPSSKRGVTGHLLSNAVSLPKEVSKLNAEETAFFLNRAGRTTLVQQHGPNATIGGSTDSATTSASTSARRGIGPRGGGGGGGTLSSFSENAINRELAGGGGGEGERANWNLATLDRNHDPPLPSQPSHSASSFQEDSRPAASDHLHPDFPLDAPSASSRGRHGSMSKAAPPAAISQRQLEVARNLEELKRQVMLPGTKNQEEEAYAEDALAKHIEGGGGGGAHQGYANQTGGAAAFNDHHHQPVRIPQGSHQHRNSLDDFVARSSLSEASPTVSRPTSLRERDEEGQGAEAEGGGRRRRFGGVGGHLLHNGHQVRRDATTSHSAQCLLALPSFPSGISREATAADEGYYENNGETRRRGQEVTDSSLGAGGSQNGSTSRRLSRIGTAAVAAAHQAASICGCGSENGDAATGVGTSSARLLISSTARTLPLTEVDSEQEKGSSREDVRLDKEEGARVGSPGGGGKRRIGDRQAKDAEGGVDRATPRMPSLCIVDDCSLPSHASPASFHAGIPLPAS